MADDAEVELKLEIDPTGATALADTPLFADAKPHEQQQTSVYFDTPERSLGSQGVSLRVRHIGDRRVQTVKAGGGSSAGLFARPEWESEIEGDMPVLNGRSGPLRTLFRDEVLDQINAAFEVSVTRKTWTLDYHGASIEVALDEGQVDAKGRLGRVREVELELKSGSPHTLFALARDIDALVPVHLGMLTKHERGLRLIDGTDAKPLKAEPLSLSKDMTVAQGFQRIAQNCVRQFRINEPLLFETGEAGALHQARVALRRLRCALSIFKAALADDKLEGFRADFRWLAAELGEVRNIDVLVLRFTGTPHEKRLRKLRSEALKKTLGSLRSARSRRLMIDFAEWSAMGPRLSQPDSEKLRNEPIKSFARETLGRYRRRLKRRGHHLAGLDDHERHLARIEAKKLRYSAEFFASLFVNKKQERRKKAFLKGLEQLQERLGELNDLATGPVVIEQAGLDPEVIAAVFQQGRPKAKLVSAAAEAYGDLIDVKPFW
jgi:inorganic triphosphatase YgiF